MSAPTLNQYQVTVQFDTNEIDGQPLTIWLGDEPFTELPVPQGISLIVFQVVTLPPGSTPEAQFPTYPIEWFTNDGGPYNTPIAQPGAFQVNWYNPRQCTVVVTNTALDQNSHPFNVLVSYKNQTYGTDPTIINLPPESPPV